MRKLLSLLLFVFMTFSANAQLIGHLGMRDSRYVYVGAEIDYTWYAGVEHSVYGAKFDEQRIRLQLGYKWWGENCSWAIRPYVGKIWNGDYWDLGTYIDGTYKPFDFLELAATINPHYDSGLDFKTFYQLGAKVMFNQSFGVTADYTTVPEIREKDERVRLGLHIRSGNLIVQPQIAFPVNPADSKRVRIVCGIDYMF